MRPQAVVLIDPPPPGPAKFEMMPPMAMIAAEAIRLGQQVAGHAVDRGRIAAVLGECAAFEAMHAAPHHDDTGKRLATSDDTWELAVAVSQELASMGQAAFDIEAIRVTRRRMEVCMKHLELL